MKRLTFILLTLFALSCSEEENQNPAPINATYFPPIDGNTWETIDPTSLGWDLAKQDALLQYLSQNGTRAFIVLVDGKIAIEQYWGENINQTAPFDRGSFWYWASAGKTLTAMLVGIAQEKGLLDINRPTSDYLGEQWTSLPPEKENLILVKHQLTMSTGLDYEVPNLDCTDPACLQYKTDAGQQWYYHNAPYTLLEQVVSQAAGTDYNSFTTANIGATIGMDGFWRASGFNNVYYSTARDAARFGLLLLNEGKWGESAVLSDGGYFAAMVNPSQSLNPSYGYLTWLNGQSSVRLPGSAALLPVTLSENAPDDLYAALGKNGQIIDVIPSKNMVVVRMGQAPDDGLVPIIFHDEMWALIGEMVEW